jgi:hypothetical protein
VERRVTPDADCAQSWRRYLSVSRLQPVPAVAARPCGHFPTETQKEHLDETSSPTGNLEAKRTFGCPAPVRPRRPGERERVFIQRAIGELRRRCR